MKISFSYEKEEMSAMRRLVKLAAEISPIRVKEEKDPREIVFNFAPTFTLAAVAVVEKYTPQAWGVVLLLKGLISGLRTEIKQLMTENPMTEPVINYYEEGKKE